MGDEIGAGWVRGGSGLWHRRRSRIGSELDGRK